VALAWLLGVWPPPLWWRDHWPRETALMREAAVGTGHAAGSLHRPTPLRQLPALLPRMVIIGEDSRFRTHHGIDPAEIGDALGLDHGGGAWQTLAAAWGRRDQLRGASTITQQLAKNLYLSPSRNALRKAKEAVTALRLELALPKDRILELYLNLVEWGPGIWGADAASRAYFGVPASRLTEEQAAALAATLPHPLTSNPTFRPDRMLARRDLILARYYGIEVSIPSEEESTAPATPSAAVDSSASAGSAPANPTADSVAAARLEATPDTAWVGRDSLP
jgi:monofunctional glycosyltransferase